MFSETSGYNIQGHIASGGFAEIFAGYHQETGHKVAVKVTQLPQTNRKQFIKRFVFEADLIMRLSHPRIVPLHDYWYDSEATYLVMEYMAGGNLTSHLYTAPLKIGAAATLLRQIASALNMAHSYSIVHQDIKPANILLDIEGNAYLTDFGIARDIKSDVNLAHDLHDRMNGSPTYISPEHLRRKEITHRSDIYSLGILMFEALTGFPPFMGRDTITILRHHIHSPLPSLQEVKPDLPDELNQPLQRATMKDPNLRYDSVLDFAHDFQKVVIAHQARQLLTQQKSIMA